MSGEQLPALKRRAYKDQVFCWIENGETEKVKKFIDMYEIHAKQFTTMNNWSLPMFACRYGNLELLQYLAQKKFTLDGVYQYTLVHAACFGNELEVLRYLIDVMKKEPVPHNEQQPPLKICFKAENQQLSELLISRGAYFQYNSFCHNVRVETITTAPSGVTQNKYKTSQRIRNEVVEIDVPSSLVFTRQNISQESSMLQFLRFIRIKNFMHARRIMDSPNQGGIVDERKKENFSSLLKIAFSKDPNYNSQARILEFLVGKKESKENASNTTQANSAQEQNQQSSTNNTNNTAQSFQNQSSQGNQYAQQPAQLPAAQQGQQPTQQQ